MSKTYTITFDEKKKRYRLTPETGRAILVRADHKKFEWLKSQEKGKIVKISESGRWTSSKDYDGLYDAVKILSKEKIIDNTSSTKVIKAKSAKNKGDIKKSEGRFTDIIRCDEIEYLVWKWRPSGEENSTKKENAIRYGSSLRVKDGELAVFVYKQKNGENQDFIIGPHDQTIKSENFPILTSIVGTAFGGESPFQAEIYFINLSDYIRIRFDIPFFDVFDSRFADLPLPLAVKGSYILQITDYQGFVKLNPLKNLEYEDFKKTVKKTVTKHIKTVLVNFNATYEGIPILQIERKILQINDEAVAILRKLLDQDFGINLKALDISSLKFDKDCDNYKEVKALYIPAKEKPNNDAEAESDELFEKLPWAKKWRDNPKEASERAKSILGYHELNPVTLQARIDRYVEADLTGENIDQNIDPKSDKWPLIEKKSCLNCNETGKVISFSTESTGFLNLIKKEVRTESVCSNCNGAGFIEKEHYPYRLEEGEEKYYKIKCDMNLDLVVKVILDKFITMGEFTKSELLKAIDRPFCHSIVWPKFKEKYLHNLWSMGVNDKVDNEKIDWSFIKHRYSEMEDWPPFLYITDDDIEDWFIPLLFKEEIIDNGTKKRPKKDDTIYYKFTNKSKNIYKDL